MLSRVALRHFARERGAVAAALREPATRFFAVVFALPFGFFAVLSAVKLIGLHWMLAFVPYFFVAAGGALVRAPPRGAGPSPRTAVARPTPPLARPAGGAPPAPARNAAF